MLDRNERCPVCHTHPDEWDEDALAYQVDTWRCLGCEKLEWEKQSWVEEGNTKGLYFRLAKPDDKSRGSMTRT